jgi:hypothetical protein
MLQKIRFFDKKDPKLSLSELLSRITRNNSYMIYIIRNLIETQATLNTRHRMKTIQRHRQHWTQDTGWRQSRDTGNIEHKTQDEDNPETRATLSTRHRMKTIQRLLNVTCVSGLSSSCVLCSMLPVSLDCLHPVSCAQDEDNPETQATLNTRHRMKTIQRHR